MAEDWGANHVNDWELQHDRLLPKIVILLLTYGEIRERDATDVAAKIGEERAKKLRRAANATANAGEGDAGSIEAATCLDAEAAGAASVAKAIRNLGSAVIVLDPPCDNCNGTGRAAYSDGCIDCGGTGTVKK